jgi:hypothetical protein
VGLRDRMATVAFPRRRHVSVVGDNGGRHLQHQRGEGQNHLASKLLEGGAHRIGGGRGGGGSNFDGFAGETRTGGRGWRERAQHDFLPWMGRVDEGKRKGRRGGTDRLKRWRIGVRRRGGPHSDSGQQWPGHGGRGRVAVGDPRGRGGARGG